MSSTPLVAKGSFLFRPTSTKRKKSAPRTSSPVSDATGFQAFPGEPAQAARMRYQAFKECYEVVERSFKNLSQLQHRDLAVSLVEFLSKDHTFAAAAPNAEAMARESADADGAELYQWPEGSTDVLHIPTVALSAGSSTLDHSLLFDFLCKRLRKDVTPFVILISATECTTMKRLLRLLCRAAQEADSSCPDHATISGLFDWLQGHHYADASKTAKGQHQKKGHRMAACSYMCGHQGVVQYGAEPAHRPVVIALQDFEAFQASLLDDFITLCHSYMNRIPFRLIFGLSSSSSSENVSTLLPPGINGLLAMTSFHSAPALNYLHNVVEKVLFASQHPFRLGYQSFMLLVSHYLNLNHSVSTLQQGMKLAMLEHFRCMPLSEVCTAAGRGKVLAQRCFGKAECNLLRSLPSMRRYIEEQEPQTQRNLLQKSDSFKTCLVELVADLDAYDRQLLPSLYAVHSLFRDLPQQPIGKHVLDVYCSLLKTSTVEQDAFKNATQCFRLLSREEVVSRLRKCLSHLREVPENSALYQRCSDSVDQLQKLSTRSASISDDVQSSRGHAECPNGPTGTSTDNVADSSTGSTVLSTAERRHRLHQRLRSYKAPTNDQQKEFNACLVSILEELRDYFSITLRSPSVLPLSELFYCGARSALLLKQTSLASPRLAVQQALLNPQPVLQCKCCEESPDAPTASMPPLCIAYWICTECPRNINLHDWLVSFFSIVKGSSTGAEEITGARKKKRKAPAAEKKKVDDSVWQSAFIQAVAELQLLGFIKPTKQKTDHVRRLVWGRC